MKTTKINGYFPDVIFGTEQGDTICGLLNINPKALWDETGLIKLLQEKGYKTYPQKINQCEYTKLDGGYTVENYGCCSIKQRLEAIQFEVKRDIRSDPQRREQFARDMAECILNFVSPYISGS